MIGRRRRSAGERVFTFCCALYGLLFATPPALFAEEPTCEVAIFLTASAPYKEVAVALRDELTRAHRRCETVELQLAKVEPPGPDVAAPASRPAGETDQERAAHPAIARLQALKPKIVVAVGTAATTLARQSLPGTPIVYCMVANIEDRDFSTNPPDPRLHGVTTDVEPAEQVRWIKRLNPVVQRLAVLHGARSKCTADALVKAAREQGIQIEKILAAHGDFPAAIKALGQKGADGVLMIADADVYDSASVQRLLLWGLRGRKPIWAFSPNVVKAGAFAGLYPETSDVARQAAALTVQLLDHPAGTKPVRQYPRRVLTAVNEHTAEMIHITLDTDTLKDVALRVGQE